MLTRLFDFITRVSVRARYVTFLLTVAVLAAGAWSYTQLNQELVPPVEFPQTFVFTQWSDAADVDEMLSEITIPLETAFQEIEGVVNVETTTNASFAVIIVRNEFGLDQTDIADEIQEVIDEANLPDTAEPDVLKFSLSDIPVMALSVSSDSLTLPELKAQINDELVPLLEGLEDDEGDKDGGVEGVASADVDGGQELPAEALAELEAAESGADAGEGADAEAGTTERVVEESGLSLALRAGLRAYGINVSTINEITPSDARVVAYQGQLALQALTLLTDDNLLNAQAASLAYLPSDFTDQLDDDVREEIDGIAAEYGGVGQFTLEEAQQAKAADLDILTGQPLDDGTVAELGLSDEDVTAELSPLSAIVVEIAEPDGSPLPESWVQYGEENGVELDTTDDVTLELFASFVTVPDEVLVPLFAELTPELIGELPAEIQSILSVSDEDEDEESEEVVSEEVEPLPLPQSWVQAGQFQGITLETTADITPELLQGFAAAPPELVAPLFAELTPELIAAFSPEAVAVLPPELIPDTQPITPSNLTTLPQGWLNAFAALGIQVTAVENLTPDLLQSLYALEPTLFDALESVHREAMTQEMIDVLPDEYFDSINAGARADFRRAGLNIEREEADPAALNPILTQQAAALGDIELETIDDLTPDLVRTLAGLGDISTQFFGLLTEDNLRLMTPEVLGLLPDAYTETLDPELVTYLDGRAIEYGGVGQLLLREAELAAEMAAASPPMSGIWLEPNPEGEPSQFQTAADILNNPFAPGAAAFLNVFPDSPNVENPADWIGAITPDVVDYLIENEDGFIDGLFDNIIGLMAPETLQHIVKEHPDTLNAERQAFVDGILSGSVEVFVPDTTITRNSGNPALIVNVFGENDSNVVKVSDAVDIALDEYKDEYEDTTITEAFGQADFIRESIEGVRNEGLLGAAFAVLIILAFLSGRINGRYKLSWRATLITALSIPASILFAFLLMWFVPRFIGPTVADLADGDVLPGLFKQLAKLFPDDITLNIMTLSGLTVAIGRVVDDSIVVLENSYRYIQKGEDPFEAVRKGTKEVATAIFAATVTTMAVFLPLGFVGGVISAFFLPFGLTVTYALIASYIVSITVVPALTYLFIRKENIPEERETWMQRTYTPILEWTLNNRIVTMLGATLIFAGSMFLLTQLPTSFLPTLGEPTVNVNINLPPGTDIIETNKMVVQLEREIDELDSIESVLTNVGGGSGLEASFAGGVSQNQAALTITPDRSDEDFDLDELTDDVRELAEEIFTEENVVVTAAADGGPGGGFGLIVTGENLDEIVAVDEEVRAVLEELDADEDGNPDMVNVSSNAEAAADGTTVIRIDGVPALNFTAELETSDTLGVAASAKEAIDDVLPTGLTVTEGFDSQEQAEGFQGMISAIGVSILLVYIIMAFTFKSLVHPLTILFTLPFALVGAAIALFITNSVLGISAMMGLLMLVGVVVTNGIVLLELVQQLRDEGIPAYEALVEAGRTRLRPIWMTALTAILALIPLATSGGGGAIIASELGRAVMGGLIVSTALTLIVIPVVYSLFNSLLQPGEQKKMEQLARRYGYRLNKSVRENNDVLLRR